MVNQAYICCTCQDLSNLCWGLECSGIYRKNFAKYDPALPRTIPDIERGHAIQFYSFEHLKVRDDPKPLCWTCGMCVAYPCVAAPLKAVPLHPEDISFAFANHRPLKPIYTSLLRAPSIIYMLDSSPT